MTIRIMLVDDHSVVRQGLRLFSFPGHLGLHSMRERITNLGGTFEIESIAGAGTRICVRISLI
jgi:signal transduction histidine kinase